MDKRIYLLTTLTFIVGLVELIIGGILPFIAADLDISLGQAGLLISAFSLSFAIAGPVLLSLTAKMERKKLIMIVLVLFLFSNGIAVVSNSLLVLLISRILSASGAALLVSLCLTIASQISLEAYRSRAIGTVLMGVSASLVLGVPLGLFLGNEWGWRAPFVFIVAVTFILMVLIQFTLNSIKPKPYVPLSTQLRALRKPTILLVHSVSILFFIGHLTLYAFLTPFLQSTLHVSGNALSFLYLLFGIAAICGSWFGGYASDRFGNRQTMVVALAFFAFVLFIVPLVSTNGLLLIPLLMLWNFLSWTITPAIQGHLVASAPKTSDIQQSINNSATHVGMAIGSVVGGLTIDVYTVDFNAPVGGFFAVIGLIVAIIAVKIK
ncbi:MFS transporter [Shouchella lehensis]|uniref:MFS transporter n=1 Tax=Shouchella lehensis TaxID=300825 RepID=A0A4Y7WJC3_9BACI|nr:MFS transporter [Shouchella lehensis]MBG9785969.1 major facilitator transporter [Shouchella lehensis]TES48449.1 MFS transporter [Shouchella lehensis]